MSGDLGLQQPQPLPIGRDVALQSKCGFTCAVITLDLAVFGGEVVDTDVTYDS
ncbi:MAG: hypothetical protein IH818_10770 [Acidobacteria bacterium]|nr:hypothetical protein [Acidobacteriota bacterium]